MADHAAKAELQARRSSAGAGDDSPASTCGGEQHAVPARRGPVGGARHEARGPSPCRWIDGTCPRHRHVDRDQGAAPPDQPGAASVSPGEPKQAARERTRAGDHVLADTASRCVRFERWTSSRVSESVRSYGPVGSTNLGPKAASRPAFPMPSALSGTVGGGVGLCRGFPSIQHGRAPPQASRSTSSGRSVPQRHGRAWPPQDTRARHGAGRSGYAMAGTSGPDPAKVRYGARGR